MLGRLGLVIHWVSFLATIPIILHFLINPEINYIPNPNAYELRGGDAYLFNELMMDRIMNRGQQESVILAQMSEPARFAVANEIAYTAIGTKPFIRDGINWLYTLILMLLSSLLLLGAGWLINFILAGHRSPLPWVANKEAT